VDFCVSSVETGVPKPNPKMFAVCAEKAGCDPRDMVMVGDNPIKDIDGALEAGWRAILVQVPTGSPEGEAARRTFDLGSRHYEVIKGKLPPTAIVDSVRQIRSVLQTWASSQ